MGFTNDILAGLAQLLAANNIGVYSTTTPYANTDVGIFTGTIPQSPPSVIVLNTYPVENEPGQSDQVLGVQFHIRSATGDPGPANDLADLIFDTLNGAEHLNLSGRDLLVAWRHNGTPMGQDSLGRHELAENYYCRVNHPTALTE